MKLESDLMAVIGQKKGPSACFTPLERPTPETDAGARKLCLPWDNDGDRVREVVFADFARRLERERDEARAEVRKLEVQLDHYHTANDMAEEAFRERDDARAEVAKLQHFKQKAEADELRAAHENDQLKAEVARLLEALICVKREICRSVSDGYSQPCVDDAGDKCDAIIDQALRARVRLAAKEKMK